MTAAAWSLVLAHLPMAVRMARARVGTRQLADIEDAEAAAVLGLIEAAARYRPERGAPFGAWAYLRMKGAIASWQRANHVIAMPDGSQSSGKTEVLTIALDDAQDPSATETPESLVAASEMLRVLRARLGGEGRGVARAKERRLAVLDGMARGDRPLNISRELGVNKARVSQIGRQIRDTYQELAA